MAIVGESKSDEWIEMNYENREINRNFRKKY